MENINFSSLIGSQVTILSKFLDPTLAPVNATVRGVEAGGIWIETQHLTDLILKAIGQSTYEATPVFFLSFAAIYCVIATQDVPSISSEGISE